MGEATIWLTLAILVLVVVGRLWPAANSSSVPLSSRSAKARPGHDGHLKELMARYQQADRQAAAQLVEALSPQAVWKTAGSGFMPLGMLFGGTRFLRLGCTRSLAILCRLIVPSGGDLDELPARAQAAAPGKTLPQLDRSLVNNTGIFISKTLHRVHCRGLREARLHKLEGFLWYPPAVSSPQQSETSRQHTPQPSGDEASVQQVHEIS